VLYHILKLFAAHCLGLPISPTKLRVSAEAFGWRFDIAKDLFAKISDLFHFSAKMVTKPVFPL